MQVIKPLNYGNDFGIEKAGNALAAGVEKIGGIFKDRYDKKQYDDWLQGPAKDYQNTMQEAQDMLLDKNNPDAAQQAVFKIKNATSKYMDDATRFSSNPYIMSNAQRVWKGNLDFMKGAFVDPLKNAQANKANQEAANLKEQQPGLAAAQTAETNLKIAKTRQANRSPIDRNALKGIIPLLSGDPNQLAQIQDAPGETLPGSARAEAARANVLAAINSPKDAQQAKSVKEGRDQEARSMAMSQIADRAARGVIKDQWTDEEGKHHGGDVWNTQNPEHIRDAMSNIDPSLITEQYVQHVLQAESSKSGVDAKVVDQKYGVRIDPTRATPANPITRTLSDEELGKVAFGQDAWNKWGVPSKNEKGKVQKDEQGKIIPRPAKSIQDIADNLPPSYKNIPAGPFREAIDMSIRHIKEAQANGTKLTVNDVADIIRGTANGEVVGPLIGGANTPTKELPEGLRRNRMALADVSKSIAAQYAQEIAQELGIVKAAPGKKTAPASKSGIDSILNSVYSTIGGDIKAVGTATGLIKGNQ
jgi:hypothetical protein